MESVQGITNNDGGDVQWEFCIQAESETEKL